MAVEISMLKKRRLTVLVSVVIITALYWVLALWHGPKGSLILDNTCVPKKDLIVFHKLFENFFINNQWIDFWQYIYQFAVTIILFVLVPWLIVRFYLRESFKKLVFRHKSSKTAIIICCIIYPLVIISTFFTAKDPVLSSEYPLSKLIGTSWSVFIMYEICYFFYFFSYEAFFRGYLQFGMLKDKPSVKEIIIVILIQTIITTLFHIGKPVSEISMAALFGPVFGYVAIRFNSIWYGMIIHYVMNIFIDLNVLHILNKLPHHFF